jgi:IS30 family transposase
MDDAKRKNRMSRKARFKGEKHPMAKITDGDVLKMRRLFDAGLPIREIAAHIRTSYMTAYRVVKRETWKHI